MCRCSTSIPFYWNSYLEMARSIVEHEVERLPELERTALWLQTDAARGLDDECTGLPEFSVNDLDVVDQIMDALMELAGAWSNPRIRAYLDWSMRTD